MGQMLKSADLMNRIERRFNQVTPQLEKDGLVRFPDFRYCAMPLGKQAAAYDAPGATLSEVDEGTMSALFCITTTRRDHHGDVVISRGCQEYLADYANNPRIFFNHATGQLPIASARDPKTRQFSVIVQDDRIYSRAYFHGKHDSEAIFELVKMGELQGASIGFVPMVGEFIDTPNRRDQESRIIDFDSGGLIFHTWRMLEWSVVGIPANPDALRGFLDSPRSRKMSPVLRRSLEPQATTHQTMLYLWKNYAKDPQTMSTEPIPAPEPKKALDPSLQALIFTKPNFQTEKDVGDWLKAWDYELPEFLKSSSWDESPIEDPYTVSLFDRKSDRAYEEVSLRDGVYQCWEQDLEEKSSDLLPPSVAPKAEEPEKPKMPYGCELLCTVGQGLCSTGTCLVEAVALLDQPKVAKLCGKLQKGVNKMLAKISECGTELYGEKFQAPSYAGMDSCDDDEDEDDKPEKSGGQSLWAKEARELLIELSEAENLKKSQKSACQLLLSSPGEKEPESVPAPEPDPRDLMLQDQLKALQAQMARTEELFYKLTGIGE